MSEGRHHKCGETGKRYSVIMETLLFVTALAGVSNLSRSFSVFEDGQKFVLNEFPWLVCSAQHVMT